MANSDRPRGLTPVGTMNGSPWTGKLKLYECDASAANIFPGDLVTREADGKIKAVTSAADTNMLGACVAVLEHHPGKTNGTTDHSLSTGALSNIKYHATGATGVILVAVGPDVLYEAQEDGDTSTIALADVGANVDATLTVGSTTTGRSLMELDSDTVVATTAMLRIVEMVDAPDNELGSTGCRWIVRLNEHHFADTAGI